jgi:hypothetical protein
MNPRLLNSLQRSLVSNKRMTAAVMADNDSPKLLRINLRSLGVKIGSSIFMAEEFNPYEI